MPYIVKTFSSEDAGLGYLQLELLSHRAVASLHEARQDARNHVEDHAQEPGWLPEWVAARDEARSLPESGGKVGPLPDGTVIEVEWVRYQDLQGENALWYFGTTAPEGISQYIIDAYNAAQEGAECSASDHG